MIAALTALNAAFGAIEEGESIGVNNSDEMVMMALDHVAGVGGVKLVSCVGKCQGVHHAVRAGSRLSCGFRQLALVIRSDLAGQVDHATEGLYTDAIGRTQCRMLLQFEDHLSCNDPIRWAALIATLSVRLESQNNQPAGRRKANTSGRAARCAP